MQCNSPGARLNPASIPDLAPATGMEVRKLELSRPELSSEAYLIHSPEKDRPDFIEVPEEEMQRLKAKGRLRSLSLVVPVALPQHLYLEEGSSPCPLAARRSACTRPTGLSLPRSPQGHGEEHVVWLRLPAALPDRPRQHHSLPGRGCL